MSYLKHNGINSTNNFHKCSIEEKRKCLREIKEVLSKYTINIDLLEFISKNTLGIAEKMSKLIEVDISSQECKNYSIESHNE